MILNHLWQSTLAAGAAALLSVALRRNRPQLRYWLWLTASLKFLVPFALLVAIGNQLSWRAPIAGDSPIMIVIDAVSQPFTPVAATGNAIVSAPVLPSRVLEALPFALLTVWAIGFAAMLITWLVRWRRVALLIREGVPADQGREVEILRRLEAAGPGISQPLPLIVADASLEPGVFGIWRPVLLWPSSISARLTDAQIEAILAHELAHVMRRDNLAAALHMAVQSLFWFHPAVWWFGARLVDERERACDADVIRRGSVPQVYAESILKTCEFYVESPIACVSGVTGSDLKRRIEQIMRGEGGVALAGWRKLLVAMVGLAALAGPIAAGMLQAPRLQAQSSDVDSHVTFDTISIRKSSTGSGMTGTRVLPNGQYAAANVTLRMLISNAYGGPLQPLLNPQLIGGPAWIDSERFDILAKADGSFRPGDSRVPLLIRNLLGDRFQLITHQEVRQLPAYEMVVARSDGELGPQIKKATVDCSVVRGPGAAGPPPPPPPAPQAGDRPRCGIRFLRGSLSAGGMTLAQVAGALARFVGRPVVDKTDLKGGFDLDLTWVPVQRDAAAPAGPGAEAASILAAVQEQLGLQLVPQPSDIEVVVIDHVERPIVNWLYARSPAGSAVPDSFESMFVAPPPPPPPPPARRP
jgi:uncharacterized protein (TIGR03435 family)